MPHAHNIVRKGGERFIPLFTHILRMGLIYIEYISRCPGVDMADFRAGVTHGQEGWDTGYGEDQLVLNIGRTWRLGPEPEYLAVWYSPQASFDRIDDWDLPPTNERRSQ